MLLLLLQSDHEMETHQEDIEFLYEVSLLFRQFLSLQLVTLRVPEKENWNSLNIWLFLKSKSTHTSQPLYNTIVGVQTNVCASYPSHKETKMHSYIAK